MAEARLAAGIWVAAYLRRLGLADPDAVFADLQLMEGEALSTFAEAAA